MSPENQTNRELQKCDSLKLLNEVAKQRFGDDYLTMIDRLSSGFRMLKQDKFESPSNNNILEDFNFLTDMGLTVVSQVLQDDFYYGENLKIRKTHSFDRDRYILIYKKPNVDDKGISLVAFDISKDISGQVRDSYKCIKNIQKTRTTFMSNCGVDVTCDEGIRAISNNETELYVSNISRKAIEGIKNDIKNYPGKVVEITCVNSKLYPEYEEMKQRLVNQHNFKLIENPRSYFNIL
jgi:hypothetical protein